MRQIWQIQTEQPEEDPDLLDHRVLEILLDQLMVIKDNNPSLLHLKVEDNCEI
jgi:hypothetical protein